MLVILLSPLKHMSMKTRNTHVPRFSKGYSHLPFSVRHLGPIARPAEATLMQYTDPARPNAEENTEFNIWKNNVDIFTYLLIIDVISIQWCNCCCL